MTCAFALQLLQHRTNFVDGDTTCALAHLDYHLMPAGKLVGVVSRSDIVRTLIDPVTTVSHVT
jgi:CBS domain-containing protein